MTAQKHINRIGKAIVEVEEANEDVRRAAKRVTRSIKNLHDLLDDAQKAYMAEPYQGGDVIVPFSGGTNKTFPDNPDEPVEP